jgi:micrococcal nuclease
MMAGAGSIMRAWGWGVVVGFWLAALTTYATADETWIRVRWVADGDTIVLADGRHVRYIGIDAPEVDHPDTPGEPYGNAARELNHRLVNGQSVRLVSDRDPTDRYGRVLAYVFRRDGLFVNGEMVRQGFAHALPKRPNLAREEELLRLQQEAMLAGRGIWRAIDRNAHPVRPYLGNRRSKRFHAHDCPMGQRMASRNRVLLQNQWQAFWQGYAPARECIAFPK